MIRHSFQQGYVSDPIQTRRGKAFKIRYRVRTVEGKWRHKSETLYDLDGKKAARGFCSSDFGKHRIKDWSSPDLPLRSSSRHTGNTLFSGRA